MRGRARVEVIFAALAASILLGACATPRANFNTGYAPPDRLPVTPSTRSLMVIPLEDRRPPRAYASSGRFFLVYVPLLPFVSAPFERLDESMHIQSDDLGPGRGLTAKAPPYEEFTYPRSFARAIADDLRSSGLFREVHFAEVGSTEGYELVLRGSLRESPLRQTMTSFGLGAAGVLLWPIPVPMGRTSASVSLELNLADTQSGRVLWQRSLEGDVSRLSTFYHTEMTYGRGGPFAFNLRLLPLNAQVDRESLFSWHFEALRRAMLQARPELAAAVAATEPQPSSARATGDLPCRLSGRSTASRC